MEILKRKLDSERTKDEFRRVLWFYDIWGRLTESKAAKQVLEFAQLDNGESALEVACGTGVLLEEIAARNQGGRTIGMDLSPDMLERAEKRLKRNRLTNYELEVGDALALRFDDGEFDLVVNTYMVDLLPKDTFDRVASEFYRVTKPGGRVVISTFSFGRTNVHRLWFWLAKHFPGLLTGCRPVSFAEPLTRAGFEIEKKIGVSQNTFPSEVIKARKNAGRTIG